MDFVFFCEALDSADLVLHHPAIEVSGHSDIKECPFGWSGCKPESAVTVVHERNPKPRQGEILVKTP